MTKSELDEAVALVRRLLVALIGTLPTQAGALGAQLKVSCGTLALNAPAELNAAPVEGAPAPLWSDLARCFELARSAGASFAAMDAVRVLAEGFSPLAAAGLAVMNVSVRMALAEQAQILAATTFASRAEVDRTLDQVNAAFETAVDVAADRLDNVAYRALIALRAAVVHDLSTRALPLPQLVTLRFPVRFPVLTLAQRIYQDGARAGELVGENDVVHPAFMPRVIRALSA